VPNVHHTLPSGTVVGVSNAGNSLSRRLVVMCQPFEFGGAFDPDPLTTGAFDVRLLTVDLVIPDSDRATDERPAVTSEQHAALIVEYMQEVVRTAKTLSGFDYEHIGVIGWGTGCITATELGETHPAIIDKMVLVQPGAALRASELAEILPGQPAGLDGRIGRALKERTIEPAPALITTPRDDSANRAPTATQLPHDATLRITEPDRDPLGVLVAHWPTVLSHVESRGE